MRTMVLSILLVGFAASVAQAEDVSLFVPTAKTFGWAFDNGQEFPGATGSLAIDPTVQRDGKDSLKLVGDFTGGGAYVQMGRNVAALNLDIRNLVFWLRSPDSDQLKLRIVDGTDQCHQLALKIEASADWQQVVFPLERFFAKRGTPEAVTTVVRQEFWGGANDGNWHGPVKGLYVLLGAGEKKVVTVWLSDIAIAPRLTAESSIVKPASFKRDFEAASDFPEGWTVQGKVSVTNEAPFKGKAALSLDRAPADVDRPCSATAPAFAVTPGPWEIACAVKSDLKSPDNSYNVLVELECLDASGKTIERLTLADVFGQHNWQPVTKRVEVLTGSVSARFHIQMNKASGRLDVDDLSAAAVAAAPPKDTRVSRILFATAQLGNLLLPQDKRTVDVTVEATKALDPSQLELTYVVRTYWGSEISQPTKVTLESAGTRGSTLTYRASFDLSGVPLEIGRYYEVRAQIPRENDEPFTNYTTLAILPEAATKKYKAEEVPFTSRDWDNRIPEYLALADRVGVRIGGLWGGWSADPPYTPHAPLIDQCEKQGMGVLTGAPAESGGRYNEQALKQGVRAWIEKYGKVRPLYISLGNEPHVTGERLLQNVRGYRAVYEEVKKIDPTITVVATSVEPNEEYFKAGYQNWCDVFDFHIYEDYQNVRKAIEQYQALMQKYNCKKPIWSTELGLNSQGMARRAVAVEVIKKVTVFFAAGGANMAWFDYLYPDADAKLFGSSTEAHDMFDSRYSRYCPKLDAIAYSNMVNGIGIKKFVAEKRYPEGIHAFLFRDRDHRALQVLWKDKGRQDVLVPLAGVESVEVIRVDGRRSTLTAGGQGVTLSLTEDPVLLGYEGGPAALPDALGSPTATWVSSPAAIVRGASATLVVSLAKGTADSVSLLAPPFWTAQKSEGKAAGATTVQFTLASPATSAVREADLVVALSDAKGNRCGELYCRPAMSGRLEARLAPVPAAKDKPPSVKLVITNHGADKEDLTWDLSLLNERMLVGGQFAPAGTASAYFAEASKGSITVDGGKTSEVVVPLGGVDPLNEYAVRATVSDASGRTITLERFIGGFVAVPKAKGEIKMNGTLDEADWQRSPVLRLDQQRQVFRFNAQTPAWKGPADLSATLQFLWDDRYLYVGVNVTDDVFANPKEDGDIWAQDGLQFLIDPARDLAAKPGKYDYAAALGQKGPQAWCYLSADAGAPNGEAKDILVSCKRANDGTGSIIYKMAIPWSRVAPFQPAVGADLGLAMIVNEDDGAGRIGFMAWFGNPHTKEIDTVGDLVLGE